MGNNRKRAKLTKQERVAVLFQVETTLENYCRVCPFIGGNTPHKNCKTCPISGQLREYGRQLGWEDNPNRPNMPGTKLLWTDEEDLYIRNNYGKKSAVQITKEMKRSYAAVTKRIRWLREEGIL